MATIALVTQKKLPNELFWSAPIDLDSEFSGEDPLALDYLGQQVGNWLFRGFTTRTSRAQYYAVVLYGLDLVDEIITKRGAPGDDKTRNELFERWERFWALATIESRGGQLDRGDRDSMRGVRGAIRVWESSDKPLPLDFPLITRQLELGGLGAYLSSVRDYQLVSKGSMRVTPAAKAIVDAFWAEPGQRELRRQEKYALFALDLSNQKLPRKYNGLNLSGIGQSSCLSSIVARPKQQERLWNILFANSTDGSTLPLAQQLIVAGKKSVSDPEELLVGMVSGRWGKLDESCIEKVTIALAFGRLAKFLLGCFDRAYEYVDQHGGIAGREEVAMAMFPDAEMSALKGLCDGLQQAAGCQRFGKLQFHGPQFLSLVGKLQGTDRNASLDHLLAFHRGVQKTRRGSGAWLHCEQEKIILHLTGYNGYKSSPSFPNFKLGVVLRLLDDLGKLD